MKVNKTKVFWTATFSLCLLAGPASAQDNDAGPARSLKNLTGRVERADKLIGKEVIGTDNQKLGKIDDFVLDLNSGRLLYAVIGTGGFLGVEERRIAVPPGAFVQTETDHPQIAADKQKFLNAPRFRTDHDRVESAGQPAFLSEVYSYFGQTPWWNREKGTAASFNNVHRASTLIGMSVDNLSDQRLGKIEDLGVDLAIGRAVYAILDPAYKLNLGGNYLALPPEVLTFNTDKKVLQCDLSNEKLSAAPRFATENWSSLSSPSFAAQVYAYYGKQWLGKEMRPTGR